MSRKDPCGYYAVLGADQAATSDEIKMAFKAKAQQFHPDRNPAPEATREFQFINEAYRVLSNSQARANYDGRSYGPQEDGSPPAARNADPVVCSSCQRVTAQPRYVIYRKVVSVVFVTWRSVQQGIFCSECGSRRACRASGITWLLGWWGLPWGPIYSAHAIFSNMMGGERPPLKNFKILGWQASYFAQAGRFDLARVVARDALAFADKIPKYERLGDRQMGREVRALRNLLAGTGTNDGVLDLKDRWGVGSKAFRVQLGGAVVFATLIISMAFLAGGPSAQIAYKHVPPTESVAPMPTPIPLPRDAVDVPTTIPLFNEPLAQLPATGIIRALWGSSPAPSSFVADAALLAPLRVVTAAGSPNYYVKVVDWERHVARLVFFVRSGQSVTVSVPTGAYELRYAAGEKWYGEEYLFGPETMYRRADEQFDFRAEGEKVSGFTVELIKQINGNLRETPIKPSDF
jgi:DnaJ domain